MRVTNILEGLKKSGDALELPLQTSICLWAKGVGFISDKDELARAWTDFDAWRREKGFERKISGYSVDEVVVEEGATNPTAVVNCTIEGQKLKMRVPKGKPVSWVIF